MKKTRLMLAASMLAVTGFTAMTMSSCTKDDVECAVGYTGSDCKTEVRNSYNNTYRGSGTDNAGGTYTNWALKFSPIGTMAAKMQLELLDDNNVNQMLFNVDLTTNTSYSLEPKTQGLLTYTGNGSISATNASLTLTEKDNAGGSVVTTVFTFANMIKE